MTTLDDIKKLREETGAGIMDAKKALAESNNDFAKAKDILMAKGIEKAAKKGEREIKSGKVFTYIHGDGKVGAMVKLGCETDFVAKNERFGKLGADIAMQVAAMNPETIKDLLDQPYIKDSKLTIAGLVSEAVSVIGENITVEEIFRSEI